MRVRIHSASSIGTGRGGGDELIPIAPRAFLWPFLIRSDSPLNRGRLRPVQKWSSGVVQLIGHGTGNGHGGAAAPAVSAAFQYHLAQLRGRWHSCPAPPCALPDHACP